MSYVGLSPGGGHTMCPLVCGCPTLGSIHIPPESRDPSYPPTHRVHGETGSIPIQGAAKLPQLVVNPVSFPGSGQTAGSAFRPGCKETSGG